MTLPEAIALQTAGLWKMQSLDWLCTQDFNWLLENKIKPEAKMYSSTIAPRLLNLHQSGIALPQKTMNELNNWLNEMTKVGGTTVEAATAEVEFVNDNQPEVREIKYSPPGQQAGVFSTRTAPEKSEKSEKQQGDERMSQLEQRLKEIQQKAGEQGGQKAGEGKGQPQQPQQAPEPQQMPEQTPQPQPGGKSPLELALEAALAAAGQQAQQNQQQLAKAQQEAQQKPPANQEQLDDLTRRVVVLEETSEQLQEQVGKVADQAGNLEGRVADIESNYVGQQTFQDSITAFEEKLAQVTKPTVVVLPDRPEIKLNKRTHTAFPEVLLLAQLFQQAYLVGPAGTGKTTLGADVAQALGLDFGFISCSAGMAEAHLLGRMIANGNYLQSRFVELYENGGLFLFDEVDAADANTMLVLNSALANGYLSVPNRQENPVAHRHENFVCLVAANTLGTGSLEYHGRNYLDAAFLDRFAASRARVDYDLDLEREMLAGDAEMARLLHKMRFNLESTKTRRIVSTRAFISTSKLLLTGQSPQQVIDRLVLGWTDEERNRALKDVVVPKASPLKALGEKQREAEKTKREQAAAEASEAALAEKEAKSLERRSGKTPPQKVAELATA